jgi:hypothetical protein
MAAFPVMTAGIVADPAGGFSLLNAAGMGTGH